MDIFTLLWTRLGPTSANGIFKKIFESAYEKGIDYTRTYNKRRRALRNGKQYKGPHPDTVRDVWLKNLAQTCRLMYGCVRLFRNNTNAINIERIRTTFITKKKIYRKNRAKKRDKILKSYELLTDEVFRQFYQSSDYEKILKAIRNPKSTASKWVCATVPDIKWGNLTTRQIIYFRRDTPRLPPMERYASYRQSYKHKSKCLFWIAEKFQTILPDNTVYGYEYDICINGSQTIFILNVTT
jgi:hypothetical protein